MVFRTRDEAITEELLPRMLVWRAWMTFVSADPCFVFSIKVLYETFCTEPLVATSDERFFAKPFLRNLCLV